MLSWLITYSIVSFKYRVFQVLCAVVSSENSISSYVLNLIVLFGCSWLMYFFTKTVIAHLFSKVQKYFSSVIWIYQQYGGCCEVTISLSNAFTLYADVSNYFS